MNVFRILPLKENTIASSSAFQNFNASQNVIADIWYGGGVFNGPTYLENTISRHLIQFDLTNLQSKFTNFEINKNYVVSYTLNMKNSVPSNSLLETEFQLKQPNRLNKKISSSFDLIAFPINMAWDEGTGFDLYNKKYITQKSSSTNLSFTGYSNWNSATTLSAWTEPGIYNNPTASTALWSTQHFQTGGEDLSIDVTKMVNDWLSGGTPNNGIGIAYARPYEQMSSNTLSICSFYTNHTNSAFKPYLQVNYNQAIKDDRNQVTNNRKSRLFLYLFSGNSAANYFSAGTVSILNSSNAVVYSGLTATTFCQGTYYVDVWMSGTTVGQKYKDVWHGVSFNPPYDQQDITQVFQIRDNYYTSNARDVNDYVISTYGIDNNTTLNSQEHVRVYIDARMNYSLKKPFINFDIEYKLTMNNNILVIDWTSVNSATINEALKSFIDIDTSWLLTNQTYEIAFRINDLGTQKVISERLFFKVVDQFYPVKQ